MAQAWCTLGSQVTLIEASDRLSGARNRSQPSRSRFPFANAGWTCGWAREPRPCGETDRRRSHIELEDGPEVKVDELAVQYGRHPRTDDLGLESVGLEPGQWIDVDDQLRATGVEGDWLYAIGDVNARALLTHVGKYQARVAADNILGKSTAATADGARSPRVLFTDPQVAAVGYTCNPPRTPA